MKITALEIKQHEFEKSFRGYNIEEVDIFLNSIANEWERTSNEARMLRMQLEIAEKEAAKLREVEMSLIKTLQTAENTSNKITEQAKLQAERELEDARQRSSELLARSQMEAEQALATARKESEHIISAARTDAHQIIAAAKTEVSESEKLLITRKQDLESGIVELEQHKENLINQLKALTANTLRKLEILGVQPEVQVPVHTSVPVKPETEEEVKEEEEEEAEEEEIQGFASSANTLVLTDEDFEEEEEESIITHNSDDLTVIEGIGPKIDELLKSHDIKRFRDLATLPAYKIKELLAAAGPSYAMHDPGTWAEQARLADSGKWEELEDLKARLMAGRVVEKENPPANPMPELPFNGGEQATEEMLDRVNKVKAALKKAMQEKSSGSEIQKEPVREEKSSGETGGGSFFDNL